jgi:hypothetical protein
MSFLIKEEPEGVIVKSEEKSEGSRRLCGRFRQLGTGHAFGSWLIYLFPRAEAI